MTIEYRAKESEHTAKCALAAEVLRSSGQLRLQVNGWSMLPSVWPGDTLLVEHVASSSSVAEGDIVLFGRDRRFWVHRVVGRSADNACLLTRGDAMRSVDKPVHEDELLGRVVAMQRSGHFVPPRSTLLLWERLIAALVCRSVSLARIVVGVYGLYQSRSIQTA